MAEGDTGAFPVIEDDKIGGWSVDDRIDCGNDSFCTRGGSPGGAGRHDDIVVNVAK